MNEQPTAYILSAAYVVDKSVSADAWEEWAFLHPFILRTDLEFSVSAAYLYNLF